MKNFLFIFFFVTFWSCQNQYNKESSSGASDQGASSIIHETKSQVQVTKENNSQTILVQRNCCPCSSGGSLITVSKTQEAS